MIPGRPEQKEFEYERHGTQTLMANFEVATGRVISPTVGDTRTEDDFAGHIRTTIATDPNSHWIFLLPISSIPINQKPWSKRWPSFVE